jgi:pre-mRNA-splicing factor SYF1
MAAAVAAAGNGTGPGAAAAAAANLDDLMPSEDDLLYEEELLRNPYSLKMWWRYIQARADASERRRHLLFERALRALPGSYKVGREWVVGVA